MYSRHMFSGGLLVFGCERIKMLFSHSLALILHVLVTFALSFVIEIYIRKLGMLPEALTFTWHKLELKIWQSIFIYHVNI